VLERRGTPGGTPGELAGGDAPALHAKVKSGINSAFTGPLLLVGGQNMSALLRYFFLVFVLFPVDNE
jgi:hypothetical protein